MNKDFDIRIYVLIVHNQCELCYCFCVDIAITFWLIVHIRYKIVAFKRDKIQIDGFIFLQLKTTENCNI